MAAIFTAGFYQWLKYFSKDQAKLAAALTSAFQLPAFFVAVMPGNKVVSMVGSPDGCEPLQLNREAFISELGFVRGRLAYRVLGKFFNQTEYPFAIPENTGVIEFVAAAPETQGRGYTGQLIQFAMAQRGFAAYLLEVASTNTRAVRLYQRLGFTEVYRKPASKRSGVGEYVYLELREGV
jgi:ribosomal protein S18 acetylase RimI-like enzyme